MDIGTRIKQLRKGKMTAKDLAERIGVTREHLSAVENNIKPVSLQTIEKVCEILEYSLEEFFSMELTPELKQLLDTAKELTPEQLQPLIDFLRNVTVVKKTLPDNTKLEYAQAPGGRKLTEEEELAISEYLRNKNK